MKATLILAVAGLAVAQNLSGEPACATSCLSAAISSAGCAPDDQGCQCGPTQSAIAKIATPCLLSACQVSDLIIAQSVGSQLCAIYSSGIASATTTSTSTSVSMVITSSTPEPTTTSTSTSTDSVTVGSNSTTFKSGTPSPTKAATTTTKSSTTSSNLAAAATPVFIGALAAIMGAVAAL